jgi:hypothetical protein
MVAFTRLSDGQILAAEKINELQAAVENFDANTYTKTATDSLINAVNDDMDMRSLLLPMLSANYYSTFSHGLGRTGTGSMGSFTTTADRILMVPIQVPHAVTLDTIGINVTTLVASGTIRLGIFTVDLNTRVATRILDAGAVSSATTGAKGITISQPLDAGLYFLAMNCNLACGVNGEYPARGFAVSTSGVNYSALAKATAPYGAFGATESVGSFTLTESPAIYVRTV